MHIVLRLLCSSVFIATGFIFSSAAYADMEGKMPLSNMRLDSTGIDDSGPVRVEITQSKNKFESVRVTAFGKSIVLTPAQLTALGATTANSLGLAYSQGYTSTGGRTVLVLLSGGYSSGVRLISTVAFTESGELRIEQIKNPSD